MRNIKVTYYIVDTANDRTDYKTPTITEDISLAISHLMEYADSQVKETTHGTQKTETDTTRGY